MPTYEYRCPKCGHQFEVFQKITDRPVSKCPECGARAKRLISGGVGLVFRGSGFYVTDYKRKAGGETKASSGGESGGNEKTGTEKAGKKGDDTGAGKGADRG
jgi:putative FmdB family regulatory protein